MHLIDLLILSTQIWTNYCKLGFCSFPTDATMLYYREAEPGTTILYNLYYSLCPCLSLP